MKLVANCTSNDINLILRLYEQARELQRHKSAIPWGHVSQAMLSEEIATGNHWKLLINNTVACIWVTSFRDPRIWMERDKGDALYLHRIAVTPKCSGLGLVKEIAIWARQYSAEHGLKFIRMDTVGENTGLIKHYQNCGFAYLGLEDLDDVSGLPAHYENRKVCLFEMQL